MRRMILAALLSTTALVRPEPAQAGPIVAGISGFIAANTGLYLGGAGALGFGAGVAFGSSVIGGALFSIGSSFLLQSAANLFRPRPEQPDIKRELQRPNSRPAYRVPYGHTRVPGSEAPRLVDGKIQYGCLILSSRASVGQNVVIYVDKRPCTIESGDLFDFEGSGAAIKPEGFPGWNDGFFRVWMGLGDQTGPPDELLDEFGDDTSTDEDKIWPSDAWQGRTVLWFRLDAGGRGKRLKRWPRPVPNIEVEADWTRVYDPRDPAQDPDDETTWTYSANQALVLLDALRRNPVRRYPDSQLPMNIWAAAADVADEPVALNAGGAEPRYEAHGLLLWRNGPELHEQVQPIVQAGAGRLVRIGGKLGYAPGAWREPIYTMRDILEDGGLTFDALLPGRDLPAAIRAKYTAPDRDWQPAELPVRPVAGAPTPAGGDNVREIDCEWSTSPTQAARVQKIEAERAARQKRMGCTLPPAAINLVGGANLDTDLPASFARLAGTWQVESSNPGIWLSEQGVAMRVPVELRQEDAAIYAWDKATDEPDLRSGTFDPVPSVIQPPGTPSITVGASAERDDQPAIAFEVPESPTASVDAYVWEWRRSGATQWRTGGVIDASTAESGAVTAALVPVTYGADYDLRVYAEAATGRSDPVIVSDITAVAPEVDIAPPVAGTATGGAGEITVSWMQASAADLEALEIWGGDTDDVSAASLLTTIFAGPSVAVRYTETGDDLESIAGEPLETIGGQQLVALLPPATTRYYFARATGPYGSASAYAASESATTDP